MMTHKTLADRKSRRHSLRCQPAHRRSRPLRVESLEDRIVLSTFAVTSLADSGLGSLRQAILDANDQPGADIIEFDIGGGGAQTIDLLTALPSVTDPVTIDGTTQPDFAGAPLIEVDATGLSGAIGLRIVSGESTVQALAIRTDGTGIMLSSGNGNSISNVDTSWTGTDETGTGVVLSGSSGNTIENVTATNRSIALRLSGDSGDNTIIGNDFSGASPRAIFASSTGLGNKYLGNNLSGTGITALAISNDTQFEISGNDFSNCRYAVSLSDVDGITISPANMDIDVSTVSTVGLFLKNVNNSVIDGLDLSCTLAGGSGEGLLLNLSSNNTVQNVTATNRASGIRLSDGSSGNVIQENDLSGASDIAIFADRTAGSANSYLNNDLSESELSLAIYNDTELLVSGNNFAGSANGVRLANMDGAAISPENFNVDLSAVQGTALMLINVSNSQVSGLDLSLAAGAPAGTGIYLHSSSNNTIEDVTVSHRDSGIRIMGDSDNNLDNSNDNLIIRGTLFGNGTGVDLSGANNRVECSSILDGDTGITVWETAYTTSTGTVVTNSHIAGNINAGIRSYAAETVNAENNYWGAADGPSPIGSGDAIVGAVDANPYLSALPPCMMPSATIDVLTGRRGGIRADGKGVIKVALWTTEAFDAALVDLDTVSFAGAQVAHSKLTDIDDDGDLDLMLFFRERHTNLKQIYADLVAADIAEDGVLDSRHKQVEVTLTGQLVDGAVFSASDEVDLFLSGRQLRRLTKDIGGHHHGHHKHHHKGWRCHGR